MKKQLFSATLIAAIMLGALSLAVTVHAQTAVAGWQVNKTGGQASESNGVITLSGDDRAAGPSLYREFTPQNDFEVTFQLKAETLGEVHRDPLGAGEGFGFGFGIGLAPKSPGAHFELRARAGGQFLLVWHDDLCDRYGWDCNWVPFIYNGIGYNDGSAYWNPDPPVDRSNSTIKPDVWYTVKLKVTAHPFTFAAEVYTENGTFLGTHTVDTINNFTFEDIRYVGMSSGHGGTFYVRNITGIAPTSAFDFTPDEPAAFSPVVFNASGSGPQDATANFTWDFGDGNVTTTQLPVVSHVYESAGSFNVTLTVVDSEGYSGSSSQVVRVWLPSYLSISTDSSFTTVGSVVNINGRLSEYSGAGLTNEPVAVYYTFAGADSWYPISSAFTDGAGGYSIQWINSASGTFTLKAQWSGNATHTGANATATLSSLPYRSEDAFFVESNSTVTSLAFNSTSSELSFTASGAPGTVGYVKATIAKSLVPKGSDIRVQLDGKQLNYSLTETEDSWLLTFTYSHSTHRLSVYLPIDAASAKETTPPPSAEAAATPAPTNTAQIWSGDYRPLFVIIGIVAAIAVMGALFLRRKNTPEILQH